MTLKVYVQAVPAPGSPFGYYGRIYEMGTHRLLWFGDEKFAFALAARESARKEAAARGYDLGRTPA